MAKIDAEHRKLEKSADKCAVCASPLGVPPAGRTALVLMRDAAHASAAAESAANARRPSASPRPMSPDTGQPIALGHPGFQLTPLVIDFADVPRITDRDAASRLPQLAVLSVMAHPELETAEIALEVISGLPEDLLRIYTSS